jgi:hypothetical protein
MTLLPLQIIRPKPLKCGDGFYDTWGGVGYANCPPQLDAGIERLFYKNRYSQSVTSLNLYMVSYHL